MEMEKMWIPDMDFKKFLSFGCLQGKVILRAIKGGNGVTFSASPSLTNEGTFDLI